MIEGGAAQGRIGGGNVVATPGGDRRTRGLAKSASAIDQTACASIISESLHDIGVISTWDELLIAGIEKYRRQVGASRVRN